MLILRGIQNRLLERPSLLATRGLKTSGSVSLMLTAITVMEVTGRRCRDEWSSCERECGASVQEGQLQNLGQLHV